MVLWRMLYETCARAEDILGPNVTDQDMMVFRRARVVAKGGDRAYVHWETPTARLLPRLLQAVQPAGVPRPTPGHGHQTTTSIMQAINRTDTRRCPETGCREPGSGDVSDHRYTGRPHRHGDPLFAHK
ncbi:hypothetical protein [Micromonospora tarensis]|uniref:hypothetical protein n=1 Tax=Micromonospora tarensis TaxID=2806100 RepID=UPI001EE45701|nr:hypothetical protein [Micromonospora tarensis]